MPLVDKTWKSKGLKRWVISEYVSCAFFSFSIVCEHLQRPIAVRGCYIDSLQSLDETINDRLLARLDPTTGYSTQCSMEWESGAAFMKAAKEDHDLIMGDIPNYTTGKLTTIIGKIVGGS